MPLLVDRIKELRKKRKLTQQQAADLAGLKSRQAWNNIESGLQTNIKLDTLEKVAKALKVTPAYLIGE